MLVIVELPTEMTFFLRYLRIRSSNAPMEVSGSYPYGGETTTGSLMGGYFRFLAPSVSLVYPRPFRLQSAFPSALWIVP